MDQYDRDEEGPEAKAERKALKKREKAREDAHRPLDSWERYRALTDVLDDAMALVDLADHKARFAIVIMAALNVAIFFVATRTDLAGRMPVRWQPWLALYFLAYVLVALYFFLQAIESLRPRKNQPRVRYFGEAGLEEHPLGLRFYEDILTRDLEAYRRAWREIRIGQLSNEVAVQAHALAEINRAKYRALGRLYVGLQVMTLMGVGLVGVAALVTLAAPGAVIEGKPALATPHVIRTPGVAEPSGIVFHPTFEKWFLVGDEGSLAEMEADGHISRVDAVPGNLEGITVHGPSGSLLLLAEGTSELIVWDPTTHKERRRIRLDRAGLLGRAPGDPANGFEGVAFVEHAPGGTLYLVHQRAPALVVAATFDLAHVGDALGADAVTARWPLAGRGDLTDVSWSSELGRLLILADKKDRLVLMSPDGRVLGDIKVPGRQQEGVALGPDGALWIADDQDKCVLKIDGAQAVLEGLAPAPPPAHRSSPVPLVG
ncbi:MAG TPA: SdiA-regulated domain-containing protein [Vicinamibacteria bacterium]|nr:SdiA-regulated domain-containing protein [Vicinamibacteria bacterium]